MLIHLYVSDHIEEDKKRRRRIINTLLGSRLKKAFTQRIDVQHGRYAHVLRSYYKQQQLTGADQRNYGP